MPGQPILADMAAAATNAVRIIAAAGIPYELVTYEAAEDSSRGAAIRAAQTLGIDPEVLFKTLVARTIPAGGIAVYCIPGNEELDLRKAAAAAGARKVALVHERELKPLTGYVRGGCSPVGMKHRYPLFVEEIARGFERIYVNGGRKGLQVIIAPDDLVRLTGGVFADLV